MRAITSSAKRPSFATTASSRPHSAQRASFAALRPVPITLAPMALASCVAAVPTPLAAACTSTTSPMRAPACTSASHAVAKASGIDAASVSDIASGTAMSSR